MIRPASRRWSTATSSAAAPRASSSISRRARRAAARRHDRHRPYALGDAWRAERAQRPSASPPTRVAVVHNGIIENFQELQGRADRPRLSPSRPQTDTEVVAHLVTRYLDEGMTPREAVRKALARLEGAFALVMLFAGQHDLLIGARRGSAARHRLWRRRDVSRLRRAGAGAADPPHHLSRGRRLGGGDAPTAPTIFDADGQIGRARPISETALSGALIGKGNHRHFMLKEIYEQPAVIGDTLLALFNPTTRSVHLAGAAVRSRRASSGSPSSPAAPSYHAGHGREILVRAASRACRSRSISPRNSATARRTCRRAGSRSSSRNRARPPIRWRRCATRKQQGQNDRRRRQRARKLDRARGRCRAADPCRARDRRRLDQGLHHAARRARLLRHRAGAGARQASTPRARRRCRRR